MRKLNLPIGNSQLLTLTKGKRKEIIYYTVKEIKDNQYLYKITVTKEGKQSWESLGNIKNITPGSVNYEQYLDAMATVIGNEAANIWKQHKRGMTRPRAETELLKLLDR